MVKLSLRNVYKIYPATTKKTKFLKNLFSKEKKEEPDDVIAVKDFNLEIEPGEFVVFVGPSGCGKSTTLRMIAGLEDVTAGEIYMDDKLLNNVDPMNRDMAMVFQNYALYPHLTAYDNIAFGLKIRKIEEEITDKNGNKKIIKRHYKKEEIKQKVNWAASILGIESLLDRKPSEMSGGQMQRVALGRAIVRGPKVFLLDEPLSNLDAKLRSSMRSELVKLHKKINTTFIYVTHDQVEAMTMGTKIVVMKDGVIQQVDKPINLFLYPANVFVAGFIGTPQMNFFDIKFISKNKSKVSLKFESGEEIELDKTKLRTIEKKYLDNNEHDLILGIRAEHLKISPKGLNANLAFYELLGTTTHLFMQLKGLEKDFIVAVNEIKVWDIEKKYRISFEENDIHLFDKETGISIFKGESN